MQKKSHAGAGAGLPAHESKSRGVWQGLVYGLLPHTFCILFIVLSVVGATAATSVVGRFLYVPYLFQVIVGLSLVFATVSAALYLRRNGLLSREGALFKWKYLAVMYATTVGINLLFFLVVFPMVANAGFARERNAIAGNTSAALSAQETVTLQVQIPCSGHAPLVMEELNKCPGITDVRYALPDRFKITYNAEVTLEQILALPVFREFSARVQ